MNRKIVRVQKDMNGVITELILKYQEESLDSNKKEVFRKYNKQWIDYASKTGCDKDQFKSLIEFKELKEYLDKSRWNRIKYFFRWFFKKLFGEI